MSLSAFIRDHHEEIISEFAAFAKTLMPAGTDMTQAELRDHAEDILNAAVEDIRTPQTGAEQSHKSQGRGAAKAMEASGIARAIVSAYGGDIQVRSSSDAGTTFTVKLRRAS